MKRILSAFLAAGMIFSCGINVFADKSADGTVIYVAVDGNDNNDGTKDSPLASMKGARDYIRKLTADQKTNGVTVYFRGGEYQWEDVVDFGEQDSGTKDAKIVYRNFPGEKPLMSGGYKVSGNKFQKLTDKNVLDRIPEKARKNIRVVDLKKLGIADKINEFGKVRMAYYLDINKPIRGMEIFVEGIAYEPARWPNKDKFDLSQYVGIESVVRDANDWDLADPKWAPGDEYPIVKVNEDVIEHISEWKDINNVQVAGPLGWEFGEATVGLVDINKRKRELTFDYACEGGYMSTGRFYFQNVLDELDVPGEYYMDKDNQKMYVYFDPKTDLNTADVHMSIYDKPAMVNADGLSYVEFKGLRFKYSQCMGFVMRNIDDVDFYNCEFSDFSGKAMDIRGTEIRTTQIENKNKALTVKNIDIKNCKFENLGNGAIRIESGNWYTLESSGISIENCDFTNLSRIKSVYSPGIYFSGGGATIRNNTMDYSPCVLVQFTAYDSVFEYNELSNGLRETSDMGMLYGGTQPYIGSRISYNYIHDTAEYVRKDDLQKNYNFNGFKYPMRAGLYIDVSAEAATMDHNIIENIPVGIMALGSHTTATNNILIDSCQALKSGINNRVRTTGFEKESSTQFYYTVGLVRDNPNEAWLVKHPECFEWKERANKLLDSDPTLLYYPYSNFSDNLITYNKLLTYCFDKQAQLTDAFVGIDALLKGGSTVENNEFTYFDPGFEDANNDKYTIKSDAEILKKLPGLAEINQDDMGYMPKNVTDILDGAAVFKTGSNEFFAGGSMNGFSENASDTPFEKDGKLYVPLETAVNSLGGTVDADRATLGDQTADFTETVNSGGIIYVSAESLSKLGKTVEVANGIVVISDKPSFSAYTRLAEFLNTLMR